MLPATGLRRCCTEDPLVADRYEAPAAPGYIVKHSEASVSFATGGPPAVAIAAVQDSIAADRHEPFAVRGDTEERHRGAGVGYALPVLAVAAVHDRPIASDCDEPVASPSDAAQIGAGSALTCPVPADTVIAMHDRAGVSNRHEALVAPGDALQTPIGRLRRPPALPIAAVNDGVVADGDEASGAPYHVVEPALGGAEACLEPAVAVAAAADGARVPNGHEEVPARRDAAQFVPRCSERGFQSSAASHQTPHHARSIFLRLVCRLCRYGRR